MKALPYGRAFVFAEVIAVIVERRIIEVDGNIVEIERIYDEDDYLTEYLPLPLRTFTRPVSLWEDLGWIVFTDFEDFEEDE